MEIFVIIVILLVCGGLGSAVAPKNKTEAGFVLGLMLGPIGILIAAVMK